MEELQKRVVADTLAEVEQEMGKQNASAERKIKTLEVLCKEMEGIAKEKVELEREKAQDID